MTRPPAVPSSSANSPAENSPAVRICSFESRRATETRALIEKMGGIATVAPSMQEVPLTENSEALEFAEQLFAGKIGTVVFMTGVGTRQLFNVVQTRWLLPEFLEALQKTVLVSRGPKPVKILREEKIAVDYVAPEPNTWRELLQTMTENLKLDQQTVAVQEYGLPNEEFYAALAREGARICPVPVYRWTFPDDPEPLYQAIRQTLAGKFDVLAFTSANQATHVFQAADQLGLKQEWIAAARQRVVASIGPTASEHLIKLGLPPDLEASPPKLGPFIRMIIEKTPHLGKKRFS